MNKISSKEPHYWLFVDSLDNFNRTIKHGFSAQGMKSRHRRKAEKMASGDGFVYYLTGVQAFAALAFITGPYFESHEPIWHTKKHPDEDFPWRIPLKPEVVLAPEAFVPATEVVFEMEHPKRWPAQHWHLAFQGNIREIGEGDFTLLRSRLQKALKG